jgi:protein-S-isoprenylcysteine O-methyltransferase Ste14
MPVISYINLHNALVPPVVLAMMWYFSNWSTKAFIYLSLHGTYSMLWLIKEQAYPDRRFQEIQPILIGLLFIFLALAGYYIAPYLLISRHVVLPPWAFGLAISIFTLGIFLHFVADAQKFYTLRIQKGLIENGLFSHTRNPNYLGEILIYSAYAILSWLWLLPATAPPASAAVEVATGDLASPGAVATKRCHPLRFHSIVGCQAATTANPRSGCRGRELHSHIRCPRPTTPAAELAIWQASLYPAPE